MSDTTERGEAAEQYIQRFRHQARRRTEVAAGVLLAAALLWLWFFAWLMLDYDAEYMGSAVPCDAPMSREVDGEFSVCQEARDWPKLVLLGGVATMVSIAGTALLVYGRLLAAINQHRATLDLMPPKQAPPT